MSKFSLNNRCVEIDSVERRAFPFQGMENFTLFSQYGGSWCLSIDKLFMPPFTKLCLNSIPEGNLKYAV